MKKILLSLTATSLLATGLFASSGPYVGVNLGMSDTDTSTTVQSGASLDESATSYGVFAGFSFNDYLAAEVNYNDFGKAKLGFSAGDRFTIDGYSFAPTVDGDMSVDAKSLGISGIVKYPLHKYITPYAKFGIQRYEITSVAETTVGYAKTNINDYDIYYGVGFQSDITSNFAARISYDMYNMDDEVDISNYSMSLIYKF